MTRGLVRRGLTGALVVALVGGACGLGDRQAQADRIAAEGERLMAQPSLVASMAVRVRVLPTRRQVVEVEPPRITPGSLSKLETVLRPHDDAASVAGVLLFVDDAMYERIAPKGVTVPGSELVAPNNLNAIVAAVHGQQIVDTVPAANVTTTTTTPGRVLRRGVQIVREWAAFDFAAIPDRDRTKHGGSFAVNPVAVLRLVTGVLTGSIERQSATTFTANVSRDKAERDLSEDARDVLDKMFTANAVTRRVFPARFSFDADGKLAYFSVTLRQQLSSKDRADLTMEFAFARSTAQPEIRPPARRGTITANTLGELVTMVSGR